MNRTGARGSTLLALGVSLARRGVTAMIALGITVSGASAIAVLAFVVARKHHENLPRIPLVASSALAFGVGVLAAFAASTRVFRRDEDGGVRALLHLHGVDPTRYVVLRVAGLAVLLAVLVGGGTLFVGLAAILAAHDRTVLLHTIQASAAALVFALAFAVTFAPVAMATLAARSRAGGYLALLAVLIIPNLLSRSLGRWIAPRWVDVCSIPGALVALRTSLAPVGVDVFMLGRALTVLAVVTVAATLLVRLELAREAALSPPLTAGGRGVIQLDALVARRRARPKIDLGPLSISLAAGSSYALVGTEDDGPGLLLAILAGEERPRKGVVTVGGSRPSPRKSVAYVPLAPELPLELTVAQYLDLAAHVRGEAGTPASERLDVLGVAPLGPCRVGRLSDAEVRTVALVEAITSRASVLLLAEPLADLDPRAVGRVASALESRRTDGATIVLWTASPADARSLARELLVFEAGKLARRTTADDAWQPRVGPRGARLYVRSEGARYLLAELAADATFQEVHADGAELVLAGKDPLAMASAVAAATRRANVEVDLLTFEQDVDT